MFPRGPSNSRYARGKFGLVFPESCCVEVLKSERGGGNGVDGRAGGNERLEGILRDAYVRHF